MKISIVMLSTLAATALASLYIGSSFYYLSPFYTSTTIATALVRPTEGNTATGLVTFTKEKDGIHIIAKISGLTPGEHGFHIHEYGDCNCPDAVCTGGHFNPTKQPHGGPLDQHRHVGDLGNVIADEKGNATYDYTDKVISLDGPHSIVGRAVIIHAQKDDLVSQPVGNAGARVGSGVIGIKK